MRKLLGLLTAAILVPFIPAARADDPPTVTARVRSVNDWLVLGEYFGGIAGQAEQVRQAVELIRGLTDPRKGLEGFDPARPVEAYAHINPGVIDSTVVVVVPVADEAAALATIAERLKLQPKEVEVGVYQVAVPDVPVPVFFRFAHRSLYVTVMSAKPLADGAIREPGKIVASDDGSLASVRVRLDGIPATVRNTFLGQLEYQIARVKEQAEPGESPSQTKFRRLLLDVLTDAAAGVLTDGRELAVRISVNPESDDVTAEATLTARPGSPTAKYLKSLGETQGLPWLGGTDPIAAAVVRWSVPEAYRNRLFAAIDEMLNEVVAKAEPGGEEPAQLAADAIAPTLQSAELDLSIAVTRTGTEKPRLVVALRGKDGKEIENLLKRLAPFVPEGDARFRFERETIKGVNLHEAEFGNADTKPAFGTQTFWFGIADERLILAIEPDPKLTRSAAKAENGPAPVIKAELSLARFTRWADQDIPAEETDKLIADIFPDGPAGQDVMKISLTGGDALTLKVTMKGRAAKFAAALDQMKKRE